MPPLELDQLIRRLYADYGTRIPVPASRNAHQARTGFLTRALAAFTIQQLSGCTLDEAAAAVVDAGGDGGIDAVHYSAALHQLFLVQAKVMLDGEGEPSSGDILKFQQGVEALLNGRLEHFTGALWQAKKPGIELCLKDEALEVVAVLAFTTERVIAPNRLVGFRDLQGRISANNAFFTFRPYNLTSLTDWVIGDPAGGLDVELVFHDPGWPQDPFETIYGQVKAKDLAELYTRHGLRLVDRNIRVFKGKTDVNEGIKDTLTNEPQKLFYFNNGLTAHCDRFHVEHVDRGNVRMKRVKAYGFSVVNGAQTLGSLGHVAHVAGDISEEATVLVRLISLMNCVDDVAFGEQITRNSNFQNQIGPRDFVTLRPEHARWKSQLALEGIHYHYQDGDDDFDADEANFSLPEALTARASLCADHGCDLVGKVLGDRKAIWSLEKSLPNAAPVDSRYEVVFRPGLSARALWRSVLLQRHVIATMKTSTSAEMGRRKEFYQHARFLVLHLVNIKSGFDLEGGMALPPDEETRLTACTQQVAEALWTVARLDTDLRHCKTVFSNAADCQRLKGATLAALAANP